LANCIDGTSARNRLLKSGEQIMRTEQTEAGGAGSGHASTVSDHALDRLFRHGRTYNAFHDRSVPDALLRQAVELALDGPTAVNSLPLRIVFVRSPEAKAKLKPTLSPGNVDKTMVAPVTAIVAFDLEFFEHLPRLFVHMDLKGYFAGDAAAARGTAEKNGTLQAGYFILALRALGLDAGPMAGFDNAAVDAAFFPDGRFKSNILVNIGYGDASKLYPRSERLRFDEIAVIA
jgi:3-hydroxypropanoate dehydrogenase